MQNLDLLDKGVEDNRKGEKRVAAAKPMTLQERILQIEVNGRHHGDRY